MPSIFDELDLQEAPASTYRLGGDRSVFDEAEANYHTSIINEEKAAAAEAARLDGMASGKSVNADEPQEAAAPAKLGGDPGYDVIGGIKDVGKLLYDIPVQTKGAIGNLFYDPLNDNTLGAGWIKESEERTAQRKKELSPEDRVKKIMPLPEFMSETGALTRGDVHDTSESTGFSGVAMGAGLIGGVAGVPGSIVAGMAASGTAAYKMDKAMITRQLLSSAEATKGEKLTTDEKVELLNRTEDARNDHALWEAGQEAVGNALTVLGVGTIFKGAAKGAVKKIALGVFEGLGGELPTETVTQIGQSQAEDDMGFG